ncbi:MAG: DNA topoisomerase IB [Acidobacteriaceae bacterium]|nr:DNA topoisomerase IB [Acidobacteriaceae bacterium]MBV9781418.1 DNA topoisomerase IB [Acidobacteriaceae bacterium]
MGLPTEIPKLPDEVQSARKAGLRYFIPKGPGIRRRHSGSSFEYLDENDKPVDDAATLERIRSLMIPPAWTSVWISPDPNGHIQAVGRDARGRKQYRYHPEYRRIRDLVKFDRMRAFGAALPKIRRVVGQDLARRGLPKRKVLAAVVKLLETTYIRVGNEEYAEENNSFGLTTLRNQHVQILGEMLKFRFRGKSGQKHEITLADTRLARVIRKCKDIPGSALFQYIDEEAQPQSIESGDVNEYLREISGGDFTAKDFRTWGGTCLAASFLLAKCADATDPETKHELKSVLVDVVKDVACKLGNKPATCKKYYIHPAIMDCYAAGSLRALAERFRESNSARLYEQIVLSLLKPLKKARAKAA